MAKDKSLMVKSTEVGVNKIVDFNFFYIKKILEIPAISGNKKEDSFQRPLLSSGDRI